MSLLVNKFFFIVSNMVFKQDIGALRGIDPALFRVNLFLYFLEPKYVKHLISNGNSKAYKYHGVS